MAVGHSFSFNGASFASWLSVLTWDFASPQVVIPRVDVAGRDGAFTASAVDRPRQLSVVCHIQAANLGEAMDRLDAFDSAMNLRVAGNLIFDEFPGRRWPCIPAGRSEPERHRYDLVFTQSFLSADPYSYAVAAEEAIELGPTLGNGTAEALETPVIGGSAYAYGLWTLKHNVSSGGSKSITLQNLTAGTVLTHVTTLETGTNGWTRYDGSRHLAEKTADAGSEWERDLGGLSSNTAFPFLVPGQVNNLRVTSTHPITVVIDYTKRFRA